MDLRYYLQFGVARLGLFIFIFNAGNEDKIEDGKKLMFWGGIALFVMFSVWGLVGILRNTFGIENFIPKVK